MRCDEVSVRKSWSARTAFWSASSTSSSRPRSACSSAASGASNPGTPALVIEASLIGFLPTENSGRVQEAGDQAGEEPQQEREERGDGDRGCRQSGRGQAAAHGFVLGILHVHE